MDCRSDCRSPAALSATKTRQLSQPRVSTSRTKLQDVGANRRVGGPFEPIPQDRHMELHRTATDLKRQQVTADRFEGSAAGGCVQMRQRFSVLPGKRARQVGHLEVCVALRLVFAGFEIEEAEGDLASDPNPESMAKGISSSTISVPRQASTSSPCLKTIRNPSGVGM